MNDIIASFRAAKTPIQAFEACLPVFHTLNPLLVQQIEDELYAWGPQLGSDVFVRFAEETQRLLELYMASPVKRSERTVMREYLSFLDVGTQKLLANGVVRRQEDPPAATTLDLVPKDHFDALNWCILTEKVDLPLIVTNAVDAAKRRNLLVESIFEPWFSFMLTIDRDLALAWQLKLAADKEHPIDADLARDMLKLWGRQEDLPHANLKLVLDWCDDDQVFRHWPAVIEEGDRLLRRFALRAWLKVAPPRSRPAQLLKMQAPFSSDKRLSRWLLETIQAMGSCVDFFLQQADEDTTSDLQQNALLCELERLHVMLTPLLICSDLIILAPTGSVDFAMAVFGFTQEYKRSWQLALEEQAKIAIRRAFLMDLMQQRPVLQTIERLCFGNDELFLIVTKELDSLSMNFDSVKQREVVVDKLCGIYSSFREQPLLATEIGRRYRRMMRVLHEDNLKRVLRNDLHDQLDHLQETLLDLSVIASDSRKFLAMRRALEKSMAELVAAEMDFTQSVRSLRSSYIRRLLKL